MRLDGVSRFARNGYEIIPALATEQEVQSLVQELTPLLSLQKQVASTRIGGLRNILKTCPRSADFARSESVLTLVAEYASRPVFPVRAIFFDKTPEANWLVPWHQDLAIAVGGRVDVQGYTGWSTKDGVLHVHPPESVLEDMVTLRLHLDDCTAENGALRVLPGSHLSGKLGAPEISRRVPEQPEVVCAVPKGGAVLMRPLLLHSSRPATKAFHRRVLHIEYATSKLPAGLNWHDI